MLPELLGRGETRGQGFYVFQLAFCDGVEDVAGPLFDEGDEGAVAQGTVGAAVCECVGERGEPDAEVGSYAG